MAHYHLYLRVFNVVKVRANLHWRKAISHLVLPLASSTSSSDCECSQCVMDDIRCHCGLEASIRLGNDIYQRRYARCPKRVRLLWSFDFLVFVIYIHLFIRVATCIGWHCLWLLSLCGSPIYWTLYGGHKRSCGWDDWGEGFMVGQSERGHVDRGRRHCKASDAEGRAPLDEVVGMHCCRNNLCHVCLAC